MGVPLEHMVHCTYVRTYIVQKVARGKFELCFRPDIGLSNFCLLLHSSLSQSLLQYRARDAASRGDKYMLVSFDEPGIAVKVGTIFFSLFIATKSLNFSPCFLPPPSPGGWRTTLLLYQS